MSDYSTCKGECEIVTFETTERVINEVEEIKVIICNKRRECFLYKRKNKRKLLVPTETMVTKDCSHFTERPFGIDELLQRFDKYNI